MWRQDKKFDGNRQCFYRSALLDYNKSDSSPATSKQHVGFIHFLLIYSSWCLYLVWANKEISEYSWLPKYTSCFVAALCNKLLLLMSLFLTLFFAFFFSYLTDIKQSNKHLSKLLQSYLVWMHLKVIKSMLKVNSSDLAIALP